MVLNKKQITYEHYYLFLTFEHHQGANIYKPQFMYDDGFERPFRNICCSKTRIYF